MGACYFPLVFLIFLGFLINGTQLIHTVYIAEKCDSLNETNLDVKNEVLLKLSKQKTSVSSCRVNIPAEAGYYFLAYVNSFGVPVVDGRCSKTRIELYGGYGQNQSLCGYTDDGGIYTITSSSLTVYVISDGKMHDMSLSITVTKYYEQDYYGKCENEHDVHCSNSRCVAGQLKCNHYENCGDGSDENDCTYSNKKRDKKSKDGFGLEKLGYTAFGAIFWFCCLCCILKLCRGVCYRRFANDTSLNTPAVIQSEDTPHVQQEQKPQEEYVLETVTVTKMTKLVRRDEHS